MAVPFDPSVSSIVGQALKRAGRTTPTALQIDEAANHALQEVKADIMLAASTHPNLLTTATTITTRGLQRYAFPQDYNEPYSIVLLDGLEEWRGTSQGGSGTTITLDASLNVSADDIEGKHILITSGSGVEEYRQILSYDTSTHVATVEIAWGSDPTSASEYIIVSDYYQLYPVDTYTQFDRTRTQTPLGKPTVLSEFSQEYLLYPVPDKAYGILNRYFVDMSKLDETGPLFIQLLREWRSLWIQGVAVKTMQRFDEDRYQSELQVYNVMLGALTNQTCRVREGHFKDV